MINKVAVSCLLVLCVAVISARADPPLLRPPRLVPGDTIGFISPASYLDNNITEYKADMARMFAVLGLKVDFSPNSFVKGPATFAGTDAQRASDVMWAFSSPHIKGIIANAGGWGCNRIVNMLDYNVIAQNPKFFMGFSDLTGCLSAISVKTGVGTFHGPMGASSPWDGTLNTLYVKEVAMKAIPDLVFVSKTTTTTIVPGVGRGRLIGGNLSTFQQLLNTAYFPSLDEPYVVFLEDVAETDETIDRMLTNLDLMHMFRNAKALVWGQCTACFQGNDFSVAELLQQKWGKLFGVPSFSGAMFGHISEQFVLPWNGQVEVNATAGTIKLLQSAVL